MGHPRRDLIALGPEALAPTGGRPCCLGGFVKFCVIRARSLHGTVMQALHTIAECLNIKIKFEVDIFFQKTLNSHQLSTFSNVGALRPTSGRELILKLLPEPAMTRALALIVS